MLELRDFHFLIGPPLNLLYNTFAVYVGFTYGNLPFMLLPPEIKALLKELMNADPATLELIEDAGEFTKTMDSVWTRLRSQ